MEYGYAFVHTFDRPGVYGYYCMPHAIDGMQGAVLVLLGAALRLLSGTRRRARRIGRTS